MREWMRWLIGDDTTAVEIRLAGAFCQYGAARIKDSSACRERVHPPDFFIPFPMLRPAWFQAALIHWFDMFNILLSNRCASLSPARPPGVFPRHSSGLPFAASASLRLGENRRLNEKAHFSQRREGAAIYFAKTIRPRH
jgi:hypothetical protein